MAPGSPRIGWPRHAILVALVVVLAGCLGAGGGAGPAETETPPDPTGTGPGNPGETGIVPSASTPSGGTRHPHNSWEYRDGTLESIVVYHEEGITFSQDAFGPRGSSCRAVHFLEFNLESDGNDVLPTDTDPINEAPQDGGPPRADVVFPGTSLLRVELRNASTPLVGNLTLLYKPANVNWYFPEVGCGHPLLEERPLLIDVGSKQSDPPHQMAMSKWKFRILVVDSGDGGNVPGLAQGTFDLQIVAFNGGEGHLDPAHPDLWGSELTYDLGCRRVDLPDQQLVVWAPNTTAHRPPQSPLEGIQWAEGKIVPLLTERVEVTLTGVNDAAGAGPVELYYHAADTLDYSRAPLLEDDGNGWGTYEIPDPDGVLGDPPYEYKTLWAFMIVPRPQAGTVPPDGSLPSGEKYSAAFFQGWVELCAVAHRDPTREFR